MDDSLRHISTGQSTLPAMARHTCVGHVKSLLQQIPHARGEGQGWVAVGQHVGSGIMWVLALHVELTWRAHVRVRLALMQALHLGVWRPMLWLPMGLLPANRLSRPQILHRRWLRLLSSLHALQRSLALDLALLRTIAC